ncbi:MAG: nicotinate phosphoribosyltransferase, partial [Mariprofundaceae bacterium]|nr:nicotinate phosphoribosyltransferase [Mariprofundaceae bacterium]
LVETQIINFLHVQTLVASKAVRMRLVCPEQLLVDFGLRRTHGLDTGLAAARAGYIAGLSGTSNVQAGARWDIPIFGTMAHAYVQAHADEEEAFLHFARSHPDNVTLLIDTYDTEEGARKVVNIAPQLKKEGIRLRAVRLDSGDLGAHARNVRRILDDGGLEETRIFASGNLDEYALQKLMDEKVPIDGFGIGTRMNTSSDMPYLDCAYKLQTYAGAPKRKTSEGKVTLPGIKQVYRSMEKGVMAHDVITTADDDATPGTPLLEPVMRAGEASAPPPRLENIRKYVVEQLQTLPAGLKTLEPKEPYPVHISSALQQLIADMDAQQ